MDVFNLRRSLVEDYRSYVESFIQIADPRVAEHVRAELEGGALWPQPLIQLNPAFESGGYIDDLVDEGLLHEECRRIFRIKPKPGDDGKELRLHLHQAQAIRAARADRNYVLTTGTGSGKSLSYVIPIVDHVLRAGRGRGIQAIVVYPMNALANSQHGELTKFLCHGYPDGQGPVRFARYTGQESEQEKQAIVANPPDILLTNYVMLELILTRPSERQLVASAKGLRFLVLDELHTYRGRQTERALRDVLGYRIYRDLKRGWRITAPNLEQCGLLEIRYLSLDELCRAEDVWAQLHPALRTATPETRIAVAKTLLDFMRRELAIKVDYLTAAHMTDTTRGGYLPQEVPAGWRAPAHPYPDMRCGRCGAQLVPWGTLLRDGREHVVLHCGEHPLADQLWDETTGEDCGLLHGPKRTR